MGRDPVACLSSKRVSVPIDWLRRTTTCNDDSADLFVFLLSFYARAMVEETKERRKNAQLAREQVAPVVSLSTHTLRNVCVCVCRKEEKANVNTVCFALVFAYFLDGRAGACLPPPFVYLLPHARLLALVPLSADPPIETTTTTTTTADACVHCPFLPLMFLFCLFPLFFCLLIYESAATRRRKRLPYETWTRTNWNATVVHHRHLSLWFWIFFFGQRKKEEIGSMQKRSDSDSVLLFKGMSCVGFIFAVSVPIHRWNAVG